jgi:Holliday junction resolvase
MSTKSKGTNAERELIHKFWANGFAAIRSAGSGSMKYPSPDILVAKNSQILAIECKVTKEKSKYFEKEEIKDLRLFSTLFNAKPYIAIKFKGEKWFFLKLDKLEETEKSFMINIEIAKNRGIILEDLLLDI